jgi:hypothetical protein
MPFRDATEPFSSKAPITREDPHRRREPLPENPTEFAGDPNLLAALRHLRTREPEKFKLIRNVFLHSRVNPSTYIEDGRAKPTVYLDTTSSAVMQVAQYFLPELADTALLTTNPTNPQYRMQINGAKADTYTAEQAHATAEIEKALSQSKTHETALLILAGFLLAERGSIRIIEPSKKHFPKGGAVIQLQLPDKLVTPDEEDTAGYKSKSDEILPRILDLIDIPKSLVSQTKATKRGDVITERIEFRGAAAAKLAEELLSIAPVLRLARPELMEVARYDKKLDLLRLRSLFEGYVRRLGDFYRGKEKIASPELMRQAQETTDPIAKFHLLERALRSSPTLNFQLENIVRNTLDDARLDSNMLADPHQRAAMIDLALAEWEYWEREFARLYSENKPVKINEASLNDLEALTAMNLIESEDVSLDLLFAEICNRGIFLQVKGQLQRATLVLSNDPQKSYFCPTDDMNDETNHVPLERVLLGSRIFIAPQTAISLGYLRSCIKTYHSEPELLADGQNKGVVKFGRFAPVTTRMALKIFQNPSQFHRELLNYQKTQKTDEYGIRPQFFHLKPWAMNLRLMPARMKMPPQRKVMGHKFEIAEEMDRAA